MTFNKQHKPALLHYVPGTGRLGYLTPCNRRSQESGLKRLGALRVAVGVFVFVALAAGAYFAVAAYIFPSVQGEAPAIEPTALVQEEELQGSAIVYHPESGLPVYENSEIVFLVGEKNPLPESYAVSLTQVCGVQVDARLREALMAMTEKAEQDMVTLEYESGYVSPKQQKLLYDAKVQDLIKNEKRTTIMAKAKAKSFVPYPLESDTQTGLCVTLRGDKAAMEETDVYRWLVKNAANFGFVFRYPQGKEAQTGLEPDLSVLRYVGNDNAIKMRQLSMCLEEYVKTLAG